MELVHFKVVEDVTEDGGVVRKIMEESKTASFKTPNEGAKVICEITIPLAPLIFPTPVK